MAALRTPRLGTWGFPTVRPRAPLAILAVAAFSTGASPRDVRADEAGSKAAAKARLEHGADLLVSHAYSQALAEFEDAYRIFPSPKIFYDIGLANVGLARNADALRAFQRFVVEAAEASSEQSARATAQIQTLILKVARVSIDCPRPGVEIVVDGKSIGRTPVAGALYLDPGVHYLLARENDTSLPIEKTFQVEAGSRSSISFPPPPALSTAIAPPVTAAASTPNLMLPASDNSHDRFGTDGRHLYSRPLFWTAIAGVAGAIALTLWLTVGRSTNDPTPSLPAMQAGVPP
jgi:hypothetical protein